MARLTFDGTGAPVSQTVDEDSLSGAAAAAIEIPTEANVTVQVPDTAAASGDTVAVPVRVGNLGQAGDVTSYGLELTFDSTVTSYAGFETGNTLSGAAGFSVTDDPDIPRVGAFGSTPINDVSSEGNEGVLIRLLLVVESEVSTTVTLTNLEFNGGSPPADPPQPSFSIDATILPGDVDESGSVSYFDAALAFQFFLERTGLTSKQQVAADMDKDGRVTPFDATLILQKVLGI
jgi:hypothetical protein